jgi:hypothetical protein
LRLDQLDQATLPNVCSTGGPRRQAEHPASWRDLDHAALQNVSKPNRVPTWASILLEDIYARARRTLDKAIVQGTMRMRTKELLIASCEARADLIGGCPLYRQRPARPYRRVFALARRYDHCQPIANGRQGVAIRNSKFAIRYSPLAIALWAAP